jgi:hypothetical protein
MCKAELADLFDIEWNSIFTRAGCTRSWAALGVNLANNRGDLHAFISSNWTEKWKQFNFSTLYNVRFEVLTALTMKNALFWDMNAQFICYRRNITSPLQSPAG